MRVARILLPILIAFAVAACARQQQAYYVVDPATGQPGPVAQHYNRGVYQQSYAQQSHAQRQQAPPQDAQSSNNSRGLFSSPQAAQQAYASPQHAEQAYAQSDAQPQYTASAERGLFNTRHRSARPQYSQQPQQSYVLQYHPPQAAGGPYVAAPYGYAYAPSAFQQVYTLDSGDKLRVVVFGQEGISGSYLVDAGGNVSLPLIGTVPARGATTQALARLIAGRLKQGYVREPHVTVTIEGYRPFFILGEVTTPGQYPYVPNMTVENAIAVAGGFSPRAKKDKVEITRNTGDQSFTGNVPLNYSLRPGDTVVVKERWF
jgi:protein involved in polysaccharide export with SLBB domain